MFPLEAIGGIAIRVEEYILPAIDDVTGLTGLGPELPDMYVFVACLATGIVDPIPCHLRPRGEPMAGHARLRQMGTLERKPGAGVIGNCVVRWPETRNIVAGLTSAAIGASGELAVVAITVAIRAGSKYQLLCEPLGVALLAGHSCVLPLQRVAGTGVIEALSGNLVPISGCVTTGAVRAQPARVRVAVAGAAVIVCHRPVACERVVLVPRRRVVFHGVAALAGDLRVFSRERVGGAGVIKTTRRLPRICPVATRAILFHLIPMLVVMTGPAGLVQPEERRGQVDALTKLREVFMDEFLFVAIATLLLRVCTLERPPGGGMVETLAIPAGPGHKTELPPRVVAVAAETGLLLNGYDHVVISLFLFHPERDLTMTLEALPRAGALAELVTLQTVPHTLERGVFLRQFSGRDLRDRTGSPDHGHQRAQYAAPR